MLNHAKWQTCYDEFHIIHRTFLIMNAWSLQSFLIISQEKINIRGNLEDRRWCCIIYHCWPNVNQLSIITDHRGWVLCSWVWNFVAHGKWAMGRKQEDKRECNDDMPGAVYILQKKRPILGIKGQGKFNDDTVNTLLVNQHRINCSFCWSWAWECWMFFFRMHFSPMPIYL